MGLHRTFLFLLVVGLLITAFRRGGGRTPSPEPGETAPPAVAKPVSIAPALTNSATDRGLAAAGRDVNKR